MRRELKEAPAMAPTAVVATSFSLKSVSRFLRAYDLEVKVIGAWVFLIFLLHLQRFLGPRRRRSAHWFVQYSAMAAYYLPTVVVFYMANAVYSSHSDNKVVLSYSCTILLMSCAQGTVTMRAFSMGDGPFKLESWRLLPWILYFGWLQWGGSIWRDHKLTLRNVYHFIVIFLLPVLYVLRAKPGSGADIMDYETKLFADHMIRESRRSSLSPSPFFHCDATNSSLYDGCKYPIRHKKGGQEDQQQWMRMITFSEVKQEGGPVKDTADADICLSYSFCWLLARRFYGFPCAEDGDAQVRDLVLTELLADDCSRAYHIVEVQLALLHDHFFTNYPSKITWGLVSVKQWVVIVLCMLAFCAIVLALEGLIIGGDLSALGILCGTGVIAVFFQTTILQPQIPDLPPYWHPIQNVIWYYKRQREEDTDPAAAVAAAAPGSTCQGSRQSYSYWRDKLGQYSLMEDYDRRSYRKAIVAWCKVHVLSQTSYKFIKHHPTEEEDVRTPDTVKRMVARTIRDIDAPSITDLQDLLRTFRQDTLTQTILTWHVATCYCDMMSQSHPLEEDEDDDEDAPHQILQEPSTVYRQVATTLSKYCAYLVAFLPELLPEHSLTAKVVLQQALQEARDLLGTTRMSMEEKTRKLRDHPEVQQDDENSFVRGVRLGQELEKLSNVSWQWKAMADFWSKTVLYIASSDKASASHIERLAQGGEFVTHLWALLCNAGILKRAAEVWTPLQPEAPAMAEEDALQPEAEAIVLQPGIIGHGDGAGIGHHILL